MSKEKEENPPNEKILQENEKATEKSPKITEVVEQVIKDMKKNDDVELKVMNNNEEKINEHDDEVMRSDTEISEAKRSTSQLHSLAMVTLAGVKWKKMKRKVVNKLHKNFEMTLRMMIGIRAVIELQKKDYEFDTAHPIVAKDEDASKCTKLSFPPGGSIYTPPHSLDGTFKFKSYADKMFASIRQARGISPSSFVSYLASNLPYLDFVTNSKSGEYFFFTQDKKFMIKTQSSGESKFLRSILRKYYKHIMRYPDSLLVRIVGMYRVQFGFEELHFIVMGNVFNSASRQIHKKFDLKGSTFGRSATDKEKRQLAPVFKDNDFENEFLHVGDKKDALIKQIDLDTYFLRDLKIMDYSMLIGIHYPNREQNALHTYGFKDKYVESKPIRDLNFTKGKNLLRIASEFDEKKERGKNVEVDGDKKIEKKKGDPKIDFLLDPLEPGAIEGRKDVDGEPAIYYLGIIDILQEYNVKKKFEYAFKSLRYDGNTISSVNPRRYARRFRDFISKHIKY